MANDIKLQSPEGIHPVDENLRPLFIGDKQSAIETAQYGNGAKVVGDLEVTGDIIGNVKDITFDSVSIDQDITTLGAETFIGLDIDIDKTGASSSNPNTIKGLQISVDNATATGGGNTVVGIRTDATLTHAADSGTTAVYGGDFYATASSDGSFNEAYGVRAIAINSDTNYGVFTQVIGGDTNNIGVKIVCEDGGDDLVLHSSANIQDYFKIQTIADGETTLTTVENGGGSTAHLSMVVDGNFTVDAHADISLDAAGGDVTILQADLTIPSDKGLKSGTMTLSASELDKAAGDFTIDVEGDLILDANGGNITLLDGGSRYVPTAASDAVPLGYLPFVLYSQFQDDVGTSKHYLPLKGYFEQSFVGNEPAGMIAPFNMKLQKIVLRSSEDISGADWKIGMWAIDSGTTHSHHHTSGFNWIQVTGGAADTNAVFDFTGTVGLAAVGSGGSNNVTAGQWIDFQIFADTDVTSSSAEFWITLFFIADLSSTI